MHVEEHKIFNCSQQILRLVLLSFLIIPSLYANDSFKHEGILGTPVTDIQNMNFYAQYFIPYNPTIIEIGAYIGTGTTALATQNPHGKIYAFEANPATFTGLQDRMKAYANVFPLNLAISSHNGQGFLALLAPETNSHLIKIPTRYGNFISVPCVTLDDWCKHNAIDRVHFLRLDVGGLELDILKSSSEILKNTLVIVTKTYFRKINNSTPDFHEVKNFLEYCDFEMLSHWYQENAEGEAIFVRKYFIDALYR